MSIAPRMPHAVRSVRRATTSLGAALALLVLSAPTLAQETERVSVDSTGVEGNNGSSVPSISGDGRYVAFMSDADNLVPGDTNGTSDIFVHDRLTMETTRVSVDSAGVEGNSDSYDSSISGDGRYVAFTSKATNLVPGDTNRADDVFDDAVILDAVEDVVLPVAVLLAGKAPAEDAGLERGPAASASESIHRDMKRPVSSSSSSSFTAPSSTLARRAISLMRSLSRISKRSFLATICTIGSAWLPNCRDTVTISMADRMHEAAVRTDPARSQEARLPQS
mgnify:CR=1 FL=1